MVVDNMNKSIKYYLNIENNLLFLFYRYTVCFLISKNIVDLHTLGEGTYAPPLYIKNDIIWSNDMIVENFTPEFRAFVDSKYNHHFTPEEILGYIYAILYHRDYRNRYLQFLKIDFPKITFVNSKEVFLQLSGLGINIICLHLMNKEALQAMPSFDYIQTTEYVDNVVKIIKPQYKEGNLYINDNLYFTNVPEEVWNYYIGGYQVLDKYLKSFKNEAIDLNHYHNMIKLIYGTILMQNEIQKIDIFNHL